MVSDEDYEVLISYKWHAQKKKKTWYAFTSKKTKNGFRNLGMHNLVSGVSFADHRDHNGLNNQRENIREANLTTNSRNKSPARKKKYKGTTFIKRIKNRPYQAVIQSEGKNYYLGCFATEIEAAKAYDAKAIELFGEFAYLNFPFPIHD